MYLFNKTTGHPNAIKRHLSNLEQHNRSKNAILIGRLGTNERLAKDNIMILIRKMRFACQ